MDVVKPFPYFQQDDSVNNRMSLTLVYDDKPNVILDRELKSEDESKALLEASERSLLEGVKMILIRPTEQ